MSKEKQKRNQEICLLFQDFKTNREIAKHFGLSEATVRTVLIRLLGKEYKQIRKQKIAMTSVKYPKGYLSKRSTYNL